MALFLKIKLSNFSVKTENFRVGLSVMFKNCIYFLKLSTFSRIKLSFLFLSCHMYIINPVLYISIVCLISTELIHLYCEAQSAPEPESSSCLLLYDEKQHGKHQKNSKS